MNLMKNNEQIGASFRDPSGFLFQRDGILYRQVNHSYQANYDRFMQSGLYERLLKSRKLVPHEEVQVPAAQPDLAYRVLRPERLAFISYPYEWSFSQLKDAALATLSIQKTALDYNLSLKDASAYNIQLHNGRPVLIDTLSFEDYREGSPWVAYRQFCQHFLAPLALMAKVDVRLNQLLRVHIDGIPLDLASRLLPFATRLQFGLFAHIHAHASAQKKYAGAAVAPGTAGAQKGKVSKAGLLGLIDSLQNTVRGLAWTPDGTEWGDYYDATNYTRDAFEHKHQIVKEFLNQAQPGRVLDLGSNTGTFSRLALEAGAAVVSADIDPAAVEKNYREMRQKKESSLLPLVLDLTNPSASIGWANEERDSFRERGPFDAVMALALVHHLAISNNVPLAQVARFFHSLGRRLVIEFIPKEDSQVQRLLASREDIFPNYHQPGFEEAFRTCYQIRETRPIEGSKRILYLMEAL